MTLHAPTQAGIDLGSVAAWVAASIAFISAAIVLWVRWRDRKQADWVLTWAQCNLNAEASVFEARFTILNCGDGGAYQLRTVGHGCEAEFRDHDEAEFAYTGRWIAPVVQAGDSVSIYAHMPLGEASWMERRPSTVLEIQWTPAPTRHRRTKRVYLDFETLDVCGKSEGATLSLHEPVLVRWRRSVPERSVRRRQLLSREGVKASRFACRW